MKTEKTIWQKSREELFQELSSTPEGLTGAEAARRLEHYGPNELQEGGRKSVLRIFLEQFADFLVIILILPPSSPPSWGMWRAWRSSWRSSP